MLYERILRSFWLEKQIKNRFNLRRTLPQAA